MEEKDKKNILVVDNDPVFVKLISHLLECEGHKVSCADGMFSCLDSLTESVPDVIFLDMVMSKINGDDICRIIRSIEIFHHCYIVIVTAIALEQMANFKEFGANECIAKGPFKVMSKHILQAIENSKGPEDGNDDDRIKGSEFLHSRQISKELLEHNQHLKKILESISQGVMEVERNRIVYVNSQAESILGVQKEKVLGANIHGILPGSLKRIIEDAGKESAVSRSSFNLPAIKIADRQVVVETFSLNDEQNLIVMLSDITERKMMESVIEATNLTENLGYIFSGIRHEIGNPVNSIKMALSVLLKNMASYDRETVVDFIERSLEEVARIEYLLTALKNYSLFESPITENVSLHDFFQNFVSLVQNDLEKQNIQVQTVMKSNDLTVVADSRALHHVMLNLITNAVDAVQDCLEPRIVITVSKIRDRVQITVDDNGKGISQADQQNLFKPFFTSKSKGTGLGLVNVRRMLNAMDGEVELESYVGLGTVVTVSLPGAGNG